MPEAFDGTTRYAIRRRIGEGGMGVVYEVFDRDRQRNVALKTLTRVDPAAIYRLKQEFRSLADVVHPNLVALHDLVSEGDAWFFTMEYVRGQSFIEHVRGAPPPATDPPPGRREPTGLLTLRSPDAVGPLESTEAASGLAEAVREGRHWFPDLAKLRGALSQLAEAVQAIHAAGKLHRDLKPNNVLVAAEGRVVVLDFGLVRERDESGLELSRDEAAVVGTPAYMAPEQAAGEPATAAADWYAVGVMLYEALAGRLPFRGTVSHVLAQKQHVDPVPPSRLAGGVPPDLDQLCQALLRRDPVLRPGFGDVAARLRLGPVVVMPPQRGTSLPSEPQEVAPPFVGRTRELAALEDGLADTRRGSPVMIYVHGPPGMGKTMLLDRFVERLRKMPSTVVLTGRCYQRESVPYKAFDAVIDALSHYLKRLPISTVEALLPRNVREIVRLFPVFDRVEAVQRAPRCGAAPNVEDPRPRAFAALKELCARIADRQPLAIVVDDLHWGDLDSAELLVELLSAPDAPALLFVAGFRTEAVETSAMLGLLQENQTPQIQALRRILGVGPLDLESGIGLALDLLGGCDDDAWMFAKAIAREGRGNPLFIAELSRHVAAMVASDEFVDRRALVGATLEEALVARIAKLSVADQRLLAVLAVADTPIEQEILTKVAGHVGEPRLAIAALRRQRLVETSRRQGYEVVEVAHEPLREVMLDRLTLRETRELHSRIAVELAATGRAEPETLARHFADAGQRSVAAEHAMRAAERARASLAFARAVHFFDLALAFGDPADGNRWQVVVRLADALSSAGRTAEAVERYLQAARDAPAAAALQLTRRGAELKVRSARVENLFRSSTSGEVSLFDGIRREVLQALLNESEVVTGRTGDLLVEGTDRAECFYVVLSGTVELFRGERGGARIPEGAVLGEVPFLLGAARTSRVLAASDDARLLAISQRSLEALTESNPRLALQLVVNLSRIVCTKATGVQRRVLGGDGSGHQ
ncbi:MAG: AAA family ATPase [Polyangiaceae bacterium]|nr:AAA family ATPase [Polyangiaceae bacterium]